MKALARTLAQSMIRQVWPAAELPQGTELNPASRVFGLDRGTPIDRYYISTFIDTCGADIRGVALEVAAPTYASRFERQLSGIEILHVSPDAKGATIIGDLTKPDQLPEGVADCFICTQTYPFIFDVAGAVRGSHRLLKPGGTLIATVSGIAQISRFDMDRWGDYWRFTQKSARMMLEQDFEPETIEIESYGNLLAAKALLDGRSFEELPHPALLDHRDEDYPVIIGMKARRST